MINYESVQKIKLLNMLDDSYAHWPDTIFHKLQGQYAGWQDSQDYKTSVLNEVVSQYRYNEKTSFNCMKWLSDGSYLLAGLSSGELVFINGHTFQKDNQRQIRSDEAFRAIATSPDDTTTILGDKRGRINVYNRDLQLTGLMPPSNQEQPLKDLTLNNHKVVSAYEDKDLYLLDLVKLQEERVLSGHGNDLQCVRYHPTQCLVASGSKDHSVRVWDPRVGDEILSINKHNNNINKIEWGLNGDWLLTCSKDQSTKLFDIRNCSREINSWKDTQEVTGITWHPFHPSVFATANAEGTITYRLAHQNKELLKIERPVKTQVFDLLFSPLGDSLCTLTNDKKLDFYARNELKRFDFTLETNVLQEEDPLNQVFPSQSQQQYSTIIPSVNVN